MKNPNEFDGHVCKFLWSNWSQGGRPNFKSLVNKTSYIAKQLRKEGWILVSDEKALSPFIYVKHPYKLDGYTCKIRWSNWTQGRRPKLQSILNKTAYVREKLEEEGWELLSEYSTCSEPLIIRNKKHFNNNLCKIQWNVWERGDRPSFQSIINKTEYVKDLLMNRGYVTEDDWEYELSHVYFTITKISDGSKYKINKNSISEDDLPDTPKYRIRRSLKAFCKGCTPKDLFDTNYWGALKEKFRYIPSGYHIDHIVPQSFFKNTWEQMRLANDPINLRLLPAKENMARNNRLRASELDEYDLWDLFYQAENPMGYKLIEDRYDLAS